MAESFLVTLASFAAALALAAAALGPFNRFAGMSFIPADLVRPAFLPIELALLVLTSVAAGLYPALVLASFSPAAVMRRDVSIRLKGGVLRRVFVVGQFAVAVALMAVTLGMARQVRYMKNAPLGFDKEQKLVAVFPGGRGSLPSGVPAERQASIKAALTGHPGVRSSALSSSVPGRGFFLNGKRVAAANAFAWPAAWFVVARWLRGFAYRSAPTAGTFLAAGGLALAVAMLSVGWKSVRAARANPVDSLRYE